MTQGIVTTGLAALVLLAVALQSVRAWRAQPADQAGEEFLRLWRSGPWAKQFYIDFWGLEIILALWMTSHAIEYGTWLTLIPCLLTMPVLGAMPAALYWILHLG